MFKRQSYRALASAAGAAALALTLSACGSSAPAANSGAGAAQPAGGSAAAGKPKTGGTLVIGFESDIGPMNIDISAGAVTERLKQAAYDRLVSRDFVNFYESPPIRPQLAEKWEMSSDGMVWTFQLRKGVKFHDGTPWNAAAAKFIFDRDSDESSPQYFKTGAGAMKANLGRVAKSEAVDEYTLKITMKQPEVNFIYLLESVAFASPEIIKKHGDTEYVKYQGGTGPFKFVKHDVGTEAIFDKNPDYWGKEIHDGGPYLDKLVVRFLPEHSTRVAALMARQVDWIVAVPPDNVAQLTADKNLVVAMESIPHTWVWRVNMKNDFMKNKKVRQAMSSAIDRERMARDLLKDTAIPAAQFWAPGSPGYRETPKEMQQRFDPEKAKALLKEAGYPNGIDVVGYVPNSGSGMMVPIPMNEFAQENLAKVGIRMKLQIVEWQTYLSRSAAGMPAEFAIFGTSLGTELPNVYDRQFHSRLQPPNGGNPQWYSNPEVDTLLDRAAKTLDEKERIAIYQNVNDIITDDVVFLNFVHDKAPIAWRKEVKGFVHTKSWSFSFMKTWLDE